MKQNKKTTNKNPNEARQVSKKVTQCHAYTDTQDNRNSRPLKDTALKTEANKMGVWLYPPFSAS